MELLDLVQKNNGREKIETAIGKLNRESCVSVFSEYVENYSNKKTLSEFESGYISLLNNDLHILAKELITAVLEDKTNEEIKTALINDRLTSPYSFDAYYDNEELEAFIDHLDLSTSIKFILITAYMRNTLIKYCEQINKTKADKYRETLKKEIQENMQAIDSLNKEIKLLENKLKESYERV